jgi:DNA-binding transcriptional MerR regulator
MFLHFDNILCRINGHLAGPARNERMSDTPRFSLQELADAFGLTARTARHYIQNILPPDHKTGRGRQARYGQDTWNCFAFLRKARQDGLSLSQVTALLVELEQPAIDRVVRGEEDLCIVPTARDEPNEPYSSPCMAADFTAAAPQSGPPPELPRWRVLYADDQLQIAYLGQVGNERREQVRMAAAYIKRICAGS